RRQSGQRLRPHHGAAAPRPHGGGAQGARRESARRRRPPARRRLCRARHRADRGNSRDRSRYDFPPQHLARARAEGGVMPIRPSNLNPPFNVVRASHVEFGVRDLEKSRAFYVDCLGYLVTAQDRQSLYLRAVEERNHHSIVLTRADTPCSHAIGFKIASEEDLDRAAFYFARKGLPTSFPEVPYQGRTLRTVDAVDMPIDFYARMDEADCMIRNYAAYRGARI